MRRPAFLYFTLFMTTAILSACGGGGSDNEKQAQSYSCRATSNSTATCEALDGTEVSAPPSEAVATLPPSLPPEISNEDSRSMNISPDRTTDFN